MATTKQVTRSAVRKGAALGGHSPDRFTTTEGSRWFSRCRNPGCYADSYVEFTLTHTKVSGTMHTKPCPVN